jgi:hypothetical protein
MNQQPVHSNKFLLWACIPFLAVSFSMPVPAETITASPRPGYYCPSTEILLTAAEELSAGLDMVMRSRAALIDKDQVRVINQLTCAGTTLHLAASRGAAARSILLIDAIIQARVGDAYAEVLAWLPLLRTSLLTLPDDATVSATNNYIGQAEDIMQGDKDGDPIMFLKEARHMLACDGLDIPLQEAMQAQGDLIKKIGQNTKKDTYDTLVDSMRRALAYALENSEK